jgi:DNA-binding SARP family transcriptional activator
MSYRRLLQNEDFMEFVGEIRERLKDQIAIARAESDTVKLFRAQGAADALESLLEHTDQEAEREEAEAKEKTEEENDDL